MTDHTPEGRHRAPGLVVVGIAALLVAVWCLTGGIDLPDVADLGWLCVAVGLLAGFALILTGARASRTKK